MKIICEFCKKEFEVTSRDIRKGRRFCGTSCSAKWRNQHYGPNKPGKDARERASKRLKELWKTPEFRENNRKRMTENNPTFDPKVVAKIKKSQLKNGRMKNNFKYGNGRISKHERMVYDLLLEHGYYYNYAIPTKLYRDAFPEINVPNSYKPDFVNLEKKICIEIDGNGHFREHIASLDLKKERCLEYLGFTVIRFTHEQVEKGEVKKWLDCYQKDG